MADSAATGRGSRAPIVLGVVLVVGGAAAAAYAFTRDVTWGMPPQASEAMTSAIVQLDGAIGKAVAAADKGARSEAENVSVRGAIGTDRATVSDLIGKELKISPDPGETIEIAQVEHASGSATVLAEFPPSAKPSPHATVAGQTIDLVDRTLVITSVREVTPNDPTKATQFVGYVADALALDLAPSLKALADASINGRLVFGDHIIPIGSPAAAGAGSGIGPVDKPLPNFPAIHVFADMMPMGNTAPPGLLYGGIGGAAFGILLIGFAAMGAMRRGARKTGGEAQSALAEADFDSRSTSRSTVASAANSVLGGPSAPVQPGFALQPGAIVGRWQVVRALGSGGMADVYLAHAKGEAGFQTLVALKIMHPHLARNVRAVEHFLDEAKLAAAVRHPNVVAIQDLGKIGNDYAIVMEYVDGVDLDRLLVAARAGGRPVPIDVGLGILRRICDGLHAAHTATAPDGSPLGVIHRDVKAANVLVSRQGQVKVVDFGIAKAATQSHVTIAGETKGTPSMMAPEQRVGEAVDVRADVYSTAAVGFEIVTNHAVNLDLAQLAHLGIEAWPHLPKPTALRAPIPPELDAILLGAMAFERDRRPADCAVLEAQLETVMKKYALSATDKDIARWVESESAYLSAMSGQFAHTVAADGRTS